MPPKKGEPKIPITDPEQLRAIIATGGLGAKNEALKGLFPQVP